MDHFYSTSHEFAPARFYHPHSAKARPVVVVSACLSGERVRYDGDSQYLPAIEWLADCLQLLPVCPEVGAGLTVPRPPVQLVGGNAAPRALGRDDPTLDVTQALADFARTSAAQLVATQSVCGYIFKSRSPSCGLGSTPLFDSAGMRTDTTSGIQAAHFQRQLPWLSYCEETDLLDRLSARVFELRCRLVFDWMHAGTVTLAARHRHYRFLQTRLATSERDILDHCARTDDSIGYLIALQRGCTQLPKEQLLTLFSAWDE